MARCTCLFNGGLIHIANQNISKLTRIYNQNPDAQLKCSNKTCEELAAWMGKKYPLVVCKDHEQDLIDIEEMIS